LAALYAEDAVVMASGREPVQGRKAIGEFFAEDFKYVPKRSITLKFLRLEASGSVLVDSRECRHDGVNAEGKPVQITGNYTTVFKKKDGKWRTTIDIFNVRTPEASRRNASRNATDVQ
jgi:ketosteroid isomerase-like protein